MKSMCGVLPTLMEDAGPKFITDEAQLPKVKHIKPASTDDFGFADPRNRPAEKPVVEWGGKVRALAQHVLD